MSSSDSAKDERQGLLGPSSRSNSYGSNSTESHKSDARGSWDNHKLTQADDEYLMTDDFWYQIGTKILKIATCLVTFICVLGGAVSSKLGLLFMISKIQPNWNATEASQAQYSPTSLDNRLYWTRLIFLAFAIPELLTFLRSLICYIFKGGTTPSWTQFFIQFTTETLHTLGLSFFVFYVLPGLDSVQGAILFTTVCIAPGVLNIFSEYHGSRRHLYLGLDIAAAVLQAVIILFASITLTEKLGPGALILPISIILISYGFWQNYVGSETLFASSKYLNILNQNLRESGYFSNVFISIWKLFVFFAIMCISVREEILAVDKFFDTYWLRIFNFAGAGQPNISASLGRDVNCPMHMYSSYVMQNPLFIQIVGGLICYIFAKFACKTGIQRIGLALPLTLAVPTTVLVLLYLKSNSVCRWDFGFYGVYFTLNHAWIWIFGFVSQAWITRHIWFPSNNDANLPQTEDLFAVPMYCGILVDQSIILNRKRENPSRETSEENSREVTDAFRSTSDSFEESDHIARIYGCVTMWRETSHEMLEVMKSIFRLDQDQNTRRITLRKSGIQHEFYEYETHIFFDDAFQQRNEESPQILNHFARIFIDIAHLACDIVYDTPIQVTLLPPVRYQTPYGGRLEWSLPGDTKLIVHLKDSSKIRQKKRWSQCMCMYYLLGHRLMDTPGMSIERKNIRAANTFILALDGDIEFQPTAVHNLIDLMKRKPKLGAVCGRIHPTGESTAVMWYQKFEYATAHWLQKATEHMIGAVLCSPGCFAVYRAKALMSDNVMKKYTTVSTKPLHYVQYDQGEDRWLCTLILQEGYGVDYCSDSHCRTHAPESIIEFYDQRRRWIPSTVANILDLIGHSRKTIQNNSDISYLFIAYLILLMVTTVLGPGAMFIMLVKITNMVFKIELWISFVIHLVLIIVFLLVCYNCDLKTQLMTAKILSIISGLLMLLVLARILSQFSDYNVIDISSIFLVIFAVGLFIAAILNPSEFICFIHILPYFILSPAMYLYLNVFSVVNLNNVSWGTREKPKVIDLQDGNVPHADPGPDWLKTNDLIQDDLKALEPEEITFWEDIIEAYLKPIHTDALIEQEMKNALRQFRNKILFIFILANSIFVLSVVIPELTMDSLSSQWKFGCNSLTVTFDSIEIAFVAFFSFVWLVQFIAMLCHRYTAFTQTLVSTEINILPSCTPNKIK